MNPRRVAALSLAALALWPAAPAAAKFVPVTSARACGPTGCTPLPPKLVSHLLSGFEGGPMGSAVIGPYYRLRVRPSFGPTFFFYLPSTRSMQVNGQVFQVGPRTAARLRAELGSNQPYPPRIVRVFAGSRQVADPQRYTALLYGRPVSPPISVWNHRDVLIGIELAGETPWSGWGGAEYFPSDRLLHVPDGVWVRVGDAQAAMIAADLHPGAPASGGSHGGMMAAGVAAGLVALAAAVAVALRRRAQVA
jgi:hypothetical protein